MWKADNKNRRMRKAPETFREGFKSFVNFWGFYGDLVLKLLLAEIENREVSASPLLRISANIADENAAVIKSRGWASVCWKLVDKHSKHRVYLQSGIRAEN